MGLLVVGGLISSLALANDARAQASFDCGKASHPSEQAICADEGLAELDRRMATEFEKAVKASTDPNAIRTAQRQWVASARDCGEDTFCLYETYADRLPAGMEETEAQAEQEFASQDSKATVDPEAFSPSASQKLGCSIQTRR